MGQSRGGQDAALSFGGPNCVRKLPENVSNYRSRRILVMERTVGPENQEDIDNKGQPSKRNSWTNTTGSNSQPVTRPYGGGFLRTKYR